MKNIEKDSFHIRNGGHNLFSDDRWKREIDFFFTCHILNAVDFEVRGSMQIEYSTRVFFNVRNKSRKRYS